MMAVAPMLGNIVRGLGIHYLPMASAQVMRYDRFGSLALFARITSSGESEISVASLAPPAYMLAIRSRAASSVRTLLVVR